MYESIIGFWEADMNYISVALICLYIKWSLFVGSYLHLVIVVVMGGMNYELKERKIREVTMGEGEEKIVIMSSSPDFTEGRGAISTLVSASTLWGKRNVNVWILWWDIFQNLSFVFLICISVYSVCQTCFPILPMADLIDKVLS